MSANSIPSPFVRATSLPANTCVSAAWMTRAALPRAGTSRNSGRVSAVVSQVEQPERVARADVGRADHVAAPALGAQRQLELALLACGEPQRDRVASLGERHAFRQAHVEVEAVDRRRRARA